MSWLTNVAIAVCLLPTADSPTAVHCRHLHPRLLCVTLNNHVRTDNGLVYSVYNVLFCVYYSELAVDG